jgi:hypothetical protein
MAVRASGSTIVVSVGRGNKNQFALPSDNRGNGSYPQLGETHIYNRWINSGTAVYARTSVTGGSDLQVTTSTDMQDEITLAAVEVVNGTEIRDAQWSEVLQPPLTSRSVTTTGPATLIAFWWGDGFPDTTPQSAVPNNGFTLIDTNAQELHSFVQCAVAVKTVTAAGTYNVTWTAMPVQGAQLWIVAVQ